MAQTKGGHYYLIKEGMGDGGMPTHGKNLVDTRP